MRKMFMSFAKRVLDRNDMYPVKMTSLEEVNSLIKKLFPLSCDKKLVRFGPNGDGGYLVPNDFEGIEACFSPGVRFVSGFEKRCAELGMKVFLADKSVEDAAEDDDLFDFQKKFVGATADSDFMTIDDWVSSSDVSPSSDLILQMDIEGYEYETLLSISDSLMERFRVIIIEFHSLDQFWNKPFFDLASHAFNKILKTHSCVHNHPNNCCGSVHKKGIQIPRVSEFTFLRNDRIENSCFAKEYPHPLDYDNTVKKTIVLPECWYKK